MAFDRVLRVFNSDPTRSTSSSFSRIDYPRVFPHRQVEHAWSKSKAMTEAEKQISKNHMPMAFDYRSISPDYASRLLF